MKRLTVDLPEIQEWEEEYLEWARRPDGRPYLTILMPTIRFNNVPVIRAALQEAESYFRHRLVIIRDLDWCRRNHTRPPEMGGDANTIVIDSDIPGQFGERNLNEGLKHAEMSGFVWCFADDNLPTPGFFETLRKEIDNGGEIIVFPMNHTSGALQAHANNMCPGGADMTQVVMKAALIGDLRWTDEITPDGVFIGKLFERHRDKFRFLQSPALDYNRLRR